jgi:hypothetical protein
MQRQRCMKRTDDASDGCDAERIALAIRRRRRASRRRRVGRCRRCRTTDTKNTIKINSRRSIVASGQNTLRRRVAAHADAADAFERDVVADRIHQTLRDINKQSSIRISMCFHNNTNATRTHVQ